MKYSLSVIAVRLNTNSKVAGYNGKNNEAKYAKMLHREGDDSPWFQRCEHSLSNETLFDSSSIQKNSDLVDKNSSITLPLAL